MPPSTDIFCTDAKQAFGFLISEFGFAESDDASALMSYTSSVDFDSPRVKIKPWWDSRDQTTVFIIAKADTFWIRPASSHRFDVFELLRMVTPSEFESLITEKRFRSCVDNGTQRPVLKFCAEQLKKHAQGLLRGDLAVCEDMLITRYCETTKGIPMAEYFKEFRQELSALPEQSRAKIEAAFATRSPRHVYFTLQEENRASEQVRSQEFYEKLKNFWLQYFQ